MPPAAALPRLRGVSVSRSMARLRHSASRCAKVRSLTTATSSSSWSPAGLCSAVGALRLTCAHPPKARGGEVLRGWGAGGAWQRRRRGGGGPRGGGSWCYPYCRRRVRSRACPYASQCRPPSPRPPGHARSCRRRQRSGSPTYKTPYRPPCSRPAAAAADRGSPAHIHQPCVVRRVGSAAPVGTAGQRLWREDAVRALRALGAWGGWDASGGGAGAADPGEEHTEVGRVAWEVHDHVPLARGRPRHLALLAVHEPVAARKGKARPHVEHLLAHLVAARERRRWVTHCRLLPAWRHSKALSWRCTCTGMPDE
eukprot:scaffold36118_cov61-Phaeocystis_antarctica.AAC.2